MRFNLLAAETATASSSTADEVVKHVQDAGGRVLASRRYTVVIDGEPSQLPVIMRRLRGWEVEQSQRSSTTTPVEGILRHRHGT